jgi:gamma-glutamyl:cysteine ligase YbdK (ATP-grasp superfamily)
MAMTNYTLFSVLGIEIEYMLVDKQTLDVQPKSDLIINAIAGHQTNDVSLGDIDISNELVMHVLELKNNGPRPVNSPIAKQFHDAILTLQPVLNDLNLQLLPTAAHPWMDPHKETKRWPHGDRSIYKLYDSIFNCQGHGWSNLQSMHINLPFSNDQEFAELHSTVRLLLPLLPALAASSPIIEKKLTGFQDSRLAFYEKNQQSIPCISGDIIPEIVHSEAQYNHDILEPMYRAIAPFDPKGLLQEEWLNSRGAIPKFERMALEIRIVDSQECVQADIAIANTIHAILKSWHENSEHHVHRPCETALLKSVYNETIKNGLSTRLDQAELFTQWQLPKRNMSVRDAWSMLIERVSSSLDNESQRVLEHILHQGNLSERIVRACNKEFTRTKLQTIYQKLADCLLENRMF